MTPWRSLCAPDVQVPLAIEAAQAGRHLILEKPIASTLDEAQCLADAVSMAGVVTIVVLVLRFAPETRHWLTSVTSMGGWRAGSARWLSGALLDDLVGMVRAGSVSHPCDVHRGLHVQRVLDAARRLSRT